MGGPGSRRQAQNPAQVNECADTKLHLAVLQPSSLFQSKERSSHRQTMQVTSASNPPRAPRSMRPTNGCCYPSPLPTAPTVALSPPTCHVLGQRAQQAGRVQAVRQAQQGGQAVVQGAQRVGHGLSPLLVLDQAEEEGHLVLGEALEGGLQRQLAVLRARGGGVHPCDEQQLRRPGA